MKWQRWDSAFAYSVIHQIEEKSADEFNALVADWKDGKFSENIHADYVDVRNVIYNVYNQYKDENGYEIDLRVGLALYELLLNDKYKLNAVDANDDDVWRFLSVGVFLDITYLREPTKDRFGVYFSHDRTYKNPKRIWLKQIWWWVHLAWQGDVERTYDVLKKFGSGRISQLLERAGKGYRTDVTRPLLKAISEKSGDTKVSQNDFRALMMLYYAKMFVIEPTLMDGGIDSFIEKLLETTEERNPSNDVT